MVEVMFVLWLIDFVLLVSYEHSLTLLNFLHELRKNFVLGNLVGGLGDLWCAVHVKLSK